MAAGALLNVKIELVRISRVPCNTASPIYLGDNLIWDPNNHVVNSVGTTNAASTVAADLYVGVALDQNPINSINQNLPFNQINVCVKGLILFTVDDNATYYPGDAVTFGAGSQLVRHSSGSGPVIGYVAAENNFTTSSGVTGGATGVTTGIVAVANVTQILVWIKPQQTYAELGPF